LIWLGIASHRIKVTGIPVRPGTAQHQVKDDDARRVLVMGGGRGMGIAGRTVRRLDRCPVPFTIDVVSGTNRKLRRELVSSRGRFQHPLRVRGYVHNAAALMGSASLLIGKPGGLTSAEAMAVGLPMVIVRPLPGQEKGNADCLVRHGAAVRVDRDREISKVVTALFEKPPLMRMMRERALALGRPRAAADIAKRIVARLAER
jgi:processive 1,2-diacylglycerol beta-glucosyltransferase